ncbi:MAG: addiction module protein [Planctomycetes bacterium]|nr:addiction module protein [Planctomycetota bacterium]
MLADALRLPPDDQAMVAGRLLRRIESAKNRNAEAAFQATLLRRWLEMETGAVESISGSALMRKLRARAAKKK